MARMTTSKSTLRSLLCRLRPEASSNSPPVTSTGAGNVVITSRTDVQVSGAGMDVTFVTNNTSVAQDLEPFSFEHADRSQVRDMTIAALGPARTTSDALDFDDSDDVVVERVKVTASRGRGIVFDGKDAKAGVNLTSLRNVVRDCIVTGAQGHGIEFLAAEDGQAINNVCFGNTRAGCSINRRPSTSRISKRITVTGGQFRGNGEDGITITESHDSLIDGALCKNNQRDGIEFKPRRTTPCRPTETACATACTDDQTTKTQDYGVYLKGTPITEINNTVVQTNNLCGNRVAGLRDDGTRTVITGNQCATNNNLPTVTPTATATATATAAPGAFVFSDGFETGNLTAWTSVSRLGVDRLGPRTGSFAAHGTSTGNAATYARKTLSSTFTDLHYRIWFKLVSHSAGSLYLLRFRNNANVDPRRLPNSERQPCLPQRHRGRRATDTTTQIALGQWHQRGAGADSWRDRRD